MSDEISWCQGSVGAARSGQRQVEGMERCGSEIGSWIHCSVAALPPTPATDATDGGCDQSEIKDVSFVVGSGSPPAH